MHRRIEEAYRTDPWDLFLQRSSHDIGFMQSSWWADFLADRGWGNFGVVFRDGDDIVGGARVLTRSFAPGKCYYYVAEGPVLPEDEGDAEQLFGAVLDYIDNKRRTEPELVSHLRFEPRWANRPSFVKGCREAGSWLEPRDTLHVDLRPDETDILAQMKPKGRYNIGVARKKGVSIVEDRSADGVTDFLDIYDETMDRHGLRGRRADYFHDLIEDLDALNCGSLFFAEYQGVRIAAALVIFFGRRATYFYGGSRSLHRQTMAPYLLHFEAMRTAKFMGCHWYDFYGIAPPDKPHHRWANISAFKRKFGGEELHFVPALDFIYHSACYADYRRSKSNKSKQPEIKQL
jgi:lipid II:glycine glycyltransferase (peptidoglycan interpeptide bridge formation enzyme)